MSFTHAAFSLSRLCVGCRLVLPNLCRVTATMIVARVNCPLGCRVCITQYKGLVRIFSKHNYTSFILIIDGSSISPSRIV